MTHDRFLLFIEMWWKTDVVKKNAKKTPILCLVDVTYLELEIIKMSLKYLDYVTKPE